MWGKGGKTCKTLCDVITSIANIHLFSSYQHGCQGKLECIICLQIDLYNCILFEYQDWFSISNLSGKAIENLQETRRISQNLRN